MDSVDFQDDGTERCNVKKMVRTLEKESFAMNQGTNSDNESRINDDKICCIEQLSRKCVSPSPSICLEQIYGPVDKEDRAVMHTLSVIIPGSAEPSPGTSHVSSLEYSSDESEAQFVSPIFLESALMPQMGQFTNTNSLEQDGKENAIICEDDLQCSPGNERVLMEKNNAKCMKGIKDCYEPLICTPAKTSISMDTEWTLSKSPSPVLSKTNTGGLSPLCMAARMRFLKGMELLIEMGADMNIADKKGMGPLHHVCESDELHDHACIELLLQCGAEVDKQDASNRTPLHFAAQSGCNNCVSLLLRYGACADVEDIFYNTPLHIATRNMDITMMKALAYVQRKKPKPSFSCSKGRTVNCQNGNREEPSESVHSEKGIEVESSNELVVLISSPVSSEEDTTLNIGSRYCTVEYASSGNDQSENLGNMQWEPTEDREIDQTLNNQVKENLRNSGEDRDTDPVLFTEVAQPLSNIGDTDRHMKIWNRFFENMMQQSEDSNGESIGGGDVFSVHQACQCGDYDAVVELIDSGVDADMTDEAGNTPLHIASASGDVGIVQLLLESAVCVNKKNQFGETPLLLSSRRCHTRCCDLLVEYGAAMEDHTIEIAFDRESCISATRDEAQYFQHERDTYSDHNTLGCQQKRIEAGATKLTGYKRHGRKVHNMPELSLPSDTEMGLLGVASSFLGNTIKSVPRAFKEAWTSSTSPISSPHPLPTQLLPKRIASQEHEGRCADPPDDLARAIAERKMLTGCESEFLSSYKPMEAPADLTVAIEKEARLREREEDLR